jgi:hypothetical protein
MWFTPPSVLAVNKSPQNGTSNVTTMTLVESKWFWQWCVTQNHRFMGSVHHPELYITWEHNISETGSVSILRLGEGDNYSVGSLTIKVRSPKGLGSVGIYLLSPEERNRPSLWNTVFSSYLEMDKVHKPSGSEYDSLQQFTACNKKPRIDTEIVYENKQIQQ